MTKKSHKPNKTVCGIFLSNENIHTKPSPVGEGGGEADG